MAVIDELARREHRRHEFGAIDHRIEPALEQADQPGAGIALQAKRLLVIFVELPLGNIAVIALDLLLGLELGAEVGRLALAPLAVLAGAVFPLVHRALGTAPDVLTHPAVDLVFGFCALRHRGSSLNATLIEGEERALLRKRKILLLTGRHPARRRPRVRQTTNAPINRARPTGLQYLPAPPLSIGAGRGCGAAIPPAYHSVRTLFSLSAHAIVGSFVNSDGLFAFRASRLLRRAYRVIHGDAFPSPIRGDFHKLFETCAHDDKLAGSRGARPTRLAAPFKRLSRRLTRARHQSRPVSSRHDGAACQTPKARTHHSSSQPDRLAGNI